MNDQVFNKFRARLIREGWFKAVLCGLTAGFAALFITAAICWFTGFKAVWICAIVFAAVAALAIPAFYYFLFRPTEKNLAKRLDSLGLEERIITMQELEGNDSFMAKRQRADAVAAIGKVDAKLIKIAISVPLIVGISVAAAFGASMLTVSSLAATNKIKSGNEIIKDITAEPIKSYTVTYEFEGGGYIEGDIVQIVDEGEDAETVVAIPDDGFAFVGWVGKVLGADGYAYEITDLAGFKIPTRQEKNVTEDITLVALFQEVEEGDGDGDGDGDGEPGEDGEPGDEGVGQPGPESEGGEEGPGNGEGNGLGAGGDLGDEKNQIINGDTYFGGDTFDNAYKDALDSIGDDDDGGSIGDYFDIIHD